MCNSLIPEPRTPDPALGPAGTGGSRTGVTLVELLITVAILAIVAIGLGQVVSTAVSAFATARSGQNLLANGRFAMERIVSFLQATDAFAIPDSSTLRMVERVLDVYDNATQAFAPAGDGLLDADNNGNRRLNDNWFFDPQDVIQFSYDSANRVLLETRPKYSTAFTFDSTSAETICAYVKNVTFLQLAPNLVQIELTLNDGQSEVTLKTRAKTRMINQ